MVGTTSRYFAIDNRAGAASVYYGDFIYGDTNSIAGTVTGYDGFVNGTFAYQVRGVQLSAKTIKSLIDLSDMQGIQTLALAGDDAVHGSSSADVLLGLVGDDLIYGYLGNDTLYGGTGQDTLVGGPGNDLLYGGEGLDFANFSGTAGQYSAEINSAGFLQITDTVALSRDGVKVVDGVERLSFDDVVLALDVNGTAGQAYRLYKAAFNRQPDSEGLGYWISQMDAGANLKKAAQNFIISTEFEKLYGSSTSDEQYINLLYENVLDRAADAIGYAYWLGEMKNGMTRAELLVQFSESKENTDAIAPLVANGIYYTPFIE